MSARPYYTDGQITLYLGDALELAQWREHGHVMVTDPPYGIGGSLGSHKLTGLARGIPVHERQEWDDDLSVRDEVLAMWGERPYAIFGSPRRIDAAPPYREVPLIWDKGNVVAMGDTRFPWRPTYELVYINGAGWSGRRDEAVLRVRHDTRAARDLGHPTPKPVALMEAIIRKAPPGVIVDPFAGTGATLIAARNLGRRAIGVEISPQYCKAAVYRITGAPLHLWDEEETE